MICFVSLSGLDMYGSCIYHHHLSYRVSHQFVFDSEQMQLLHTLNHFVTPENHIIYFHLEIYIFKIHILYSRYMGNYSVRTLLTSRLFGSMKQTNIRKILAFHPLMITAHDKRKDISTFLNEMFISGLARPAHSVAIVQIRNQNLSSSE